MTVLDRMHRRTAQQDQRALTAEGSSETGQSITQTRVKPAVIQRLEFVVTTLQGFIEENDESGMMARFAFVTRAMMDEVSEELQERDEETLQMFMYQIGEVIAWVGHGDMDRLPENLRQFVEPRREIEQAS